MDSQRNLLQELIKKCKKLMEQEGLSEDDSDSIEVNDTDSSKCMVRRAKKRKMC